MKEIKKVEKLLSELNDFEIEIEDLEIKLMELELEKDNPSITAITYNGIKTSCTNKINDSIMDKQVKILDDIEKVKREKEIKEKKVKLIKKAVKTLPKRQGEIIELRHFKKRSIKEVSLELMVESQTIFKEKRMALEKLAKLLKNQLL